MGIGFYGGVRIQMDENRWEMLGSNHRSADRAESISFSHLLYAYANPCILNTMGNLVSGISCVIMIGDLSSPSSLYVMRAVPVSE